MISESYIYKDELLKYATDLQKRRSQKRWTDRTNLLIEKELFFGFFIIRKLCETVKISDSLKAKDFPVSVLSINSSIDINFTTDHKALKYVNWDDPQPDKMKVTHICNQFIHSFLMTLILNEDDGLGGILISSDRYKSKKCFMIELDTIIQIFIEFGNNYPCTSHFRREFGTCKIIEYRTE